MPHYTRLSITYLALHSRFGMSMFVVVASSEVFANLKQRNNCMMSNKFDIRLHSIVISSWACFNMILYFYLDMIRLPNRLSVLCIVLLWLNICKCLLDYRSIERSSQDKIDFLKLNIGFFSNIFYSGAKLYYLNK